MDWGALVRARQQWEWQAHRDQWLARLAETGTLAESGRQPEDVANPCLVSLEARCVRARRQTIQRDPTEE